MNQKKFWEFNPYGLVFIIILLPFILLVFSAWIFSKFAPSQFSSGVDLLTVTGAIMGAVFTIGGLIVALASVISLLTTRDNVNKIIDERYPELLGYIHSYEANRKFDAAKWDEADEMAKKALEENPKLPDFSLEFSLKLYDVYAMNFVPLNSPVTVLRYSSEEINYGLINHRPNPPEASLVEYWLKEALKLENSKKLVVFQNLVLLYGGLGEYAEMIAVLRKSLEQFPALMKIFREPQNLSIVAYACIEEPNPAKSFEKLSELLGGDINTDKQKFITNITEKISDYTHPNLWYFLQRTNEKMDRISIYEVKNRLPVLQVYKCNDDSGKCWAGNGLRIPEERDVYLSPEELYDEIQKKYILVCEYQP